MTARLASASQDMQDGESWAYLEGVASDLEMPISSERRDLASWRLLSRQISLRLTQLALVRAQTYAVADCYDSMDDFWSNVASVDKGLSFGTYWDTYENGERRQLERVIAKGYGSQDALLLNSGMSALAVSIGSLKLRAGDCLLTGQSNYFETAGYLDRFVQGCGIQVRRVNLSRPGRLASAIKRWSPKVVLLETVVNAPSLECPLDALICMEQFVHPVYIIDNSVQSWLTKW